MTLPAIDGAVTRAVPSFEIETPPAAPAVQSDPLIDEGGRSVAGIPFIVTPDFSAGAINSIDGAVSRGPGFFFFERTYVIPRRIDLGFISSDYEATLEIYNSRREDAIAVEAISLPSGVSLVPVPPAAIPPPDVDVEDQRGAVYELTISADGEPTISGSIDITIDGVAYSIPITGTRTQIFPHRPEAPIVEDMRWKSDVIVGYTGIKQLRALRRVPRSVFSYRLRCNGVERQSMDNQIITGQKDPFGVPLMYCERTVTAAITAGDDTIAVSSTDFSEFEAGETALIWQSWDVFEALQVQSFTATTITFTSTIGQDFPAGVSVFPVRPGTMDISASSSRYRCDLQDNSVTFQISRNGQYIGDVSDFDSFNGLPVVDDGNLIRGGRTVSESFRLEAASVVDFGTGFRQIVTGESSSTRGSVQGWLTQTPEQLWRIRRLLQWLHGPQQPFYLPRYYQDLTPTGDIANGSAFDVVDVGYRGISSRPDRSVVRIVLKDGTKLGPFNVSGVTTPSAGVERVQIATAVGQAVTVAELDRIEVVERVRLAGDSVRIEHLNSWGKARIFAPVESAVEASA